MLYKCSAATETLFSCITRDTVAAKISHFVFCEIFAHTVSIYMDSLIVQFEELFKRHNNAIFRHLFYRLGDRERAKELTQEVFMRTWQQLISGKEIKFEKAFLYQVANNLFINEIRTKKSSSSLDEIQEKTGYEIEDQELNPEDQSKQKELLRRLENLTDSYREVLILRYIDGLAVQDIATILNEKETNISMRIARALAKLKDHYETKT